MERGEHIAREDLVNGRYRILRDLGQGATGSVKLVADTIEDDRLVALKTVRRKTKAELDADAEATARAEALLKKARSKFYSLE